MKKIGILYDNISGNVGDVAIGLSIRKIMRSINVKFDELVPGRFNPADYKTIIIGGGHLLRPSPDFFYDKFKLLGSHILNTCGVFSQPLDLGYLDDYQYLSVRSTGDKNKLHYLKKFQNIKVVPCTSLLLEKIKKVDFHIKKPSVGIHITNNTLISDNELNFIEWISSLGFNVYFLPITHYNFDYAYQRKLSSRINNSKVLPILQGEEIFSIIKQFNYFISSSLHGIIFSYIHNVPFIGFSNEKIRFFMKDRELTEYLFSNVEEMKLGLKKLIDNKPDYVDKLSKDLNLISEHVTNIRNILSGSGKSCTHISNDLRQIDDEREQLIIQRQQLQLQKIQSLSDMSTRAYETDLIDDQAPDWSSINEFKNQIKLKDQKIKLTENRVLNLESEIINFEEKLELANKHIGRLEDIQMQYENLKTRIKLTDIHVKNLEKKITEIEDSLGWEIVNKYRYLNDICFPAGTNRRKFVDWFATKLLLVLEDGFIFTLKNIIKRIPNVPRNFFDLNLNEQYKIWLKNNELTKNIILKTQKICSTFAYRPKISLIMPVYNTKEDWLRSAIDSLIKQIYPNWELCIADDGSTKENVKIILAKYAAANEQIKVKYLEKNLGISNASNKALDMATGEFIAFLDHDDELTPNALFEMVKLLNRQPNLDMIYSDEDKKELNGERVEPFFKPDWSPNLLLSMNYISHFTIYRKTIVDKVGRLRSNFDGSQDYDLVLRFIEISDKIGHISKPLYSWRKVPGSAATFTEAKPYARRAAKEALQEALIRCRLRGEVSDGFGGHYRVKYAINGEPKISIIIPTKDRTDLLKRCLESIKLRTNYRNYEIIIVDNGSTDKKTLAYYKTLQYKIVKFTEPFNFSKINNFGFRSAEGEHLLFLNNDVEVVDENWLEAMLEHSQRSEIGMVGALLLYPSGNSYRRSDPTIQHAGVILGVGGVANHSFRYCRYDYTNYFGLHRVIRDCSAVTGACAMIRREVFKEINGFDEKLHVAYGDIDLCLRLREKGYSIIYTPYAILYHHESATRGTLHPEDDETYMITKWGDKFLKGDPYYNPNLTPFREDYALAIQGSEIRPLAVLLDLYHLRRDLKKQYPEVHYGNYQRLIDWAVTDGLIIDDSRVVLYPYRRYYLSNASKNIRNTKNDNN